ncbi:ATP-binding protein [Pelosinus sp. sgz500959]|uniref:ATP-binding protein n=1 Tax=Pelosinus sp. sgz500959 TaxID=3242472 RepID=UPI00366B9FC0
MITSMVQIIKRRYLTSYPWLIFLLAVLLIASLWVFIQYQIKYDYDRTIKESSLETMNLAKAFEEHVRRVVANADEQMLNLQQTYERDGISNPAFISLKENAKKDPSRRLVAFYNENGTIIQSSNPNALEVNYSDREYFQVHRDAASQNLYIGKPIIGRIEGYSIIPLTRRINKPDGSFGGIIYVSLKGDYFLEFYNKIDLGQNQLISLSGTDGFNRARRVGDNLETGQDNRGSQFWENIQRGHLDASYVATNILDGVTRITSYRVLPEYPLIVAVGKSTQVALTAYEERKRGYILGTLVASLFILTLCGLLINRYVKQQRINVELSRLDRLNLVGEMAAGIGHEIRNPLTTVRGYLQWYLQKDNYTELRPQFTTMIEELDRANGIITEFLSLAKDRSIKMKLDNINDVIDALLPLLQAEAYNSGHDLQIEKNNLPDIYMDGNELRQLVLNLVRNGFDAMQSSGTLAIKSYVQWDAIILAVSDTGKGIPQSMMDKLGTPFLTTKDNGTGLGLAVCYQIAKRHGAKIDVDTSPDGTTFYVKFKIDK